MGKALIKYNNIYVETFWQGTVFVLSTRYDGRFEREAFVLAQCYEEGKEFEIIQITGYHAGFRAGYINEGILKGLKYAAITKEELIEGINFNFGSHWSDLFILDKNINLEKII